MKMKLKWNLKYRKRQGDIGVVTRNIWGSFLSKLDNFLPIPKHLTVTLLIPGIVAAGDTRVTDNEHTEFEDVFDNNDKEDNSFFLQLMMTEHKIKTCRF